MQRVLGLQQQPGQKLTIFAHVRRAFLVGAFDEGGDLAAAGIVGELAGLPGREGGAGLLALLAQPLLRLDGAEAEDRHDDERGGGEDADHRQQRLIGELVEGGVDGDRDQKTGDEP